MPKPAGAGPNPPKFPIDKIPAHAQQVLTENTPNGSVVSNSPIKSGLTTGFTAAYGGEPYLFDEDSFLLVGDLSPGTANSGILDAVTLNNDLYLFGYSDSLTNWIIKWDAETKSTSTIFTGPDTVYSAEVLENDIYFITGSKVGVLQGDIDQVAYLKLANNFISGGKLDSFNGDLLVYGSSASVTDLARLDLDTGVWTTYTLPNNAVIRGEEIGGAGNYYLVAGNDAIDADIYKIDFATGAVSLALQGVYVTSPTYDGGLLSASAKFGDDLIFAGYSIDSSLVDHASLYRLDDQTGTITQIYEAQTIGIAVLAAKSETALYFIKEEASSAETILKVTTDASGQPQVATFSADVSDKLAVAFKGSLYVTREDALYVLDEAHNELDLVFDFDGPLNLNTYPVGEVNGHLIVSSDSNGDGNYEYWSSSSPSSAASWLQISPDDVSVQIGSNYFFTNDFFI